MTESPKKERRFRVALTFPGEKRRRVAKIAKCLAKEFGQEQVLYDKFHEVEFGRMELDLYLPPLYRDESDLIVVFLCREYAQKRWSLLEWKAIRTLICTVDSARIMVLSLGPPGDCTELGFDPRTDGYIDIQNYSHTYVAEMIVARTKGTAPPPRPVPRTPVWQIVVAVAGLAGVGIGAVTAFFPTTVCSCFAKLGLQLAICERPLEPRDVARLQGADTWSFRLPPALGDRSEDESQDWLIRNLSGRPVALLLGKLEAGEPSSKWGPLAWETIEIPSGSQAEWSTGVEPMDSSGTWVVVAYDPKDPHKRVTSPQLYRFLLTRDEVSQFEDHSAMTLAVNPGTMPNLFEISQQPLLPVHR